jgi:WD40 repeat protein
VDLSRVLRQLASPSTDVQLEGVSEARRLAPAVPNDHPDRAELVRRLGALASYHEFGTTPHRPAPVAPVTLKPFAGLKIPPRPGVALTAHGALSAAFAARGAELVAVAAAGEVVRWDLTTGTVAGRVPLAIAPLSVAAFAPALDRVLCGVARGPMLICDAGSGGEVAPLGDGHPISTFAWAPCGQRIATGNPAGEVTIWNVVTGRSVATWWAHPAPVQALCFDPEGALVATGGADGKIVLWASDTGKRTTRVAEPNDHPEGLDAAMRAGTPRCLGFTGGGGYLVAGLTGGGLFLWDRGSGHRLWTPPAHAGPVRTVRTAQAGLSLATAGSDGGVALWDTLTGEPLARMAGHANPLACLATAPDGIRLASGGNDPWILLWELPPRVHRLPDHADRRALALYAHRALERLAGRNPD